LLKYLFTFKSLTYAQRGHNILTHAGIMGDIVRVPRSISTLGCGYAIRVGGKNYSRSIQALTDARVLPERVFAIDSTGKYREVPHDIS
jgi:hypothetical protein